MAFLTKKEQTIINLIKANTNLPESEKTLKIQQINHNAQIRSENYRPTFKKLFGVISAFKSDNILKSTR